MTPSTLAASAGSSRSVHRADRIESRAADIHESDQKGHHEATIEKSGISSPYCQLEVTLILHANSFARERQYVEARYIMRMRCYKGLFEDLC